jgi:hypothetical protein
LANGESARLRDVDLAAPELLRQLLESGGCRRVAVARLDPRALREEPIGLRHHAARRLEVRLLRAHHDDALLHGLGGVAMLRGGAERGQLGAQRL